jgi:hypothetical protein
MSKSYDYIEVPTEMVEEIVRLLADMGGGPGYISRAGSDQAEALATELRQLLL